MVKMQRVQLDIDSRKDFSNEEDDVSRSKTRHGNGGRESITTKYKYTYQTQHVTQIAFEWCLQYLCKGNNCFRRPVFMGFIFDNTKCSGKLPMANC
jgi:hypothetical protein